VGAMQLNVDLLGNISTTNILSRAAKAQQPPGYEQGSPYKEMMFDCVLSKRSKSVLGMWRCPHPFLKN